jgi:hypothetical protein
MKYIGRVPIIILGLYLNFFAIFEILQIYIPGTIVHGAIVVYLILWTPHPDHAFLFYAVSGIYVLLGCLNALLTEQK